MPKLRPFALFLLMAAPAFAQRPPDRRPPPVQKFDFDNDEVEAGRVLPQVEVADGRLFARHASLIRVRTTFVPELLKSADDR